MKKFLMTFVSVALALSMVIVTLSEENSEDTTIVITYEDTYSELTKDKEMNDNLPIPLNYVAYNYDYIMRQIEKVKDKEACLKAVMSIMYVINSLQMYDTDITLKDIYNCLSSTALECTYNEEKEVLRILDYITIYAQDPLGDNSIRIQENQGFVLYFDFVTDIFTHIRVDIPIG